MYVLISIDYYNKKPLKFQWLSTISKVSFLLMTQFAVKFSSK